MTRTLYKAIAVFAIIVVASAECCLQPAHAQATVDESVPAPGPIASDPRPFLPEPQAMEVSEYYRRLDELAVRALAPGSRKRQDKAIDEAIQVAARALAICEQYQGLDSPAGRIWAESGGNGEWWELVEARHWWNGWKRVKGLPPAGRTALGLAALMKPQFESAANESRWEDAVTIARRQSAALETHLGADHPYTLEARLNEARMLNGAEKYDESMALLEPLVPELAASLGTMHPKTLTGLHELASAYRWSGASDRAASLLEEVLRDRRLVLNTDHALTLQAAGDLVGVLSNLKQHERAFQVAEELRIACAEYLGDAHWRTLDAVESKAWELMELEREEEGLQAVEQALNVAERPRTLSYARRIWRLLGVQATIHYGMSARSMEMNDGSSEWHMDARAESLRKQLLLAREFPDLEQPAGLVAKRAAIADSLARAGHKQEARKELHAAFLEFAALPIQPDSQQIGLISDLGRAAMQADEHVRARELLERAWAAIQYAATGESAGGADDACGYAWLVCFALMEIRGEQGALEQGLADIDRWRSIDTQRSPSEGDDGEDLLRRNLGRELFMAGWATKSVQAWRAHLEWLSARSAIGESVVSAKRGLINALESSDGFVEAEKLCEELLAAAVAEHGEASPTSVNALNSLASVQRKAGKYDQSAATLRRVLALSEQVEVPSSDVEIYRGNLAKALVDGGHYEEATQLLQVSLVNRKAMFGEWSKEAVQIERGIVDLLIEQGRFDEAIQRLEALKPKVEKHCGRESWPYLSVLKSLRSAHQAATRYTQALRLNDDVVAVSRRVCNTDQFIFELKLAAVICSVDSDIPGAERHLSEALDLAVAQFGPDDAVTLDVLRARVEQCLDLGDYERTVGFGKQYFTALASRRQREGVLPTQTELDAMLLMMREVNASGEQRTEAATQQIVPAIQPLLDRADAELGMGNLLLRQVRQEFGKFFSARGEFEKAIAMHREVFDWYEHRLGPRHESTLRALNRLGLTQADQGLLAQAIATYRECLSRASPDAFNLREYRQAVQWNLAISLAAGGQTEEAAQLLAELGLTNSLDHLDVGRLAYLPLVERRDRWLQVDSNLAFTIRVAMISPEGLETALDAAMRRKALLQDIAAIEVSTLRARQDPTAVEAMQELAAAQRAFAQASSDDSKAPERIDKLGRRVRDAERIARLAAPSIERLEEQLHRGVPDIMEALQPGEAVVEIVRYFPSQRVSEPGSEIVLKESDQAEYTAFVLRPDPSSGHGYSLKAVSLGRADGEDGVDAKVERFRKFVESENLEPAFLPAEKLGLDDPNRRLGVPVALAKVLEGLRARIWDRIEPEVRGAKRLYVSMDGSLHDVPLEVLARRDDEGVLRYLIEWDESPEIAYLSSGRELLRRPREGNGRRPDHLFAILDPDFDAIPGVAEVDDTGAEEPTEQIAAVWGADRLGVGRISAELAMLGGGDGERRRVPRISGDTGVPERFFDAYLNDMQGMIGGGRRPMRLAIGPEASEATWWRWFSSSSSRDDSTSGTGVLVFTTHGLRWGGDKNQPGAGEDANELPSQADPLLRTGLALAGYNTLGGESADADESRGARDVGDGVLSALEITVSDLSDIELVVLTACQSGRGEQLPGEAAVGLRSGMAVAGARSSVSALWNIPTVASANFTREYLRMVVQDDVGGKQYGNSLHAFRAAQLKLLDDLRSGRNNMTGSQVGSGNTHPFWWGAFVYQGVPKDYETPEVP